MCMPIGHTLAGIAWFPARGQLNRLSTPVHGNRYELISVLLFVFISNIPDGSWGHIFIYHLMFDNAGHDGSIGAWHVLSG